MEPEHDFCLTWMSKRDWSLGRRLSTAHLAACWLVLLFSMATATTRPAPSFFSVFILDIFDFSENDLFEDFEKKLLSEEHCGLMA